MCPVPVVRHSGDMHQGVWWGALFVGCMVISLIQSRGKGDEEAARHQLYALAAAGMAVLVLVWAFNSHREERERASCEAAVEELREIYRADGLPAATERAAELGLALEPYGSEPHRTHLVHAADGSRIGYVGRTPWRPPAVCPRR